MALDYVICPHCGCRCEDDEYCAACGRLFGEDMASDPETSLLELLGSGLRSFTRRSRERIDQNQGKNRHTLDKGAELIEQDFCPTWSGLSSNIYNDDDK